MNEASNRRTHGGPYDGEETSDGSAREAPSSSSQVRPRVQVPATTRDAAERPSLDHSLQRFAQRYGVPDREMQMVRLTVAGVPRSRCPAVMDVSENTCKTLARRLLQRCGARNLADLARVVLLGELEGDDR